MLEILLRRGRIESWSGREGLRLGMNGGWYLGRAAVEGALGSLSGAGLYSELLDVSPDGDAARGLWCMAGEAWGYVGTELAREGGEWKILALTELTDIDGPALGAWWERESAPRPGPEPTEKEIMRTGYGVYRPLAVPPELPVGDGSIEARLSRRSYYRAADMRAEELDELWTASPGGRERARWNGVTGWGRIREKYVREHNLRRNEQADAFSEAGGEGVFPGMGVMLHYAVTPPRVTPAPDGAGAVAVWTELTQEAEGSPEGVQGRTFTQNCRGLFVNEGGEWRIQEIIEGEN